LRLPEVEDAPAIATLLTDSEVMRFLGGQVVPIERVGDVVEKWLERWERNGMGPFVIERGDDGRFLGRAGILVWDARNWTHATLADAGRHAQPELGWALVRSQWGNGYATEAARAVRDWARAERNVESLVSVIAPDNVASQRVAQRLGASPGETVRLPDSGEAVVWMHPPAKETPA
jgi:RimJ/RimL family protein N-acetyltransferase